MEGVILLLLLVVFLTYIKNKYPIKDNYHKRNSKNKKGYFQNLKDEY